MTYDLPLIPKERIVDRGMETLMKLEKIVELDTGKKASEIRSVTLGEFRAGLERTRGHALRFITKFPFLGRGNVMRDKTIDHATVDRLLDESLRE
jgi:hypothetical protein